MSISTKQAPPGRLSRLLTRKPDQYGERYSVSVSTTNSNRSVLLGNEPRGKRIMRSISSKLAALVAIFMMVLVGFVGTMSSAGPAHAAEGGGVQEFVEGLNPLTGIGNDIKQGFQEAVMGMVCTQGASNLGVDDLSDLMRPSTLNKATRANPTPYEKYQYSGLYFSAFMGFYSQDDFQANNGKGKAGSSGIINTLGTNSDEIGLRQWDEATGKSEAERRERAGLWNSGGECDAMGMAYLPTKTFNIGSGISHVFLWASGFLYQISTDGDSSIFNFAEDTVTSVVNSLKDNLYFNYLLPLIMMSALWMAYVGIVKRQATVAMGHLAWMAFAVITSVVFMTQPMTYVKGINELVGGVSSNLTTLTTSNVGGTTMCSDITNGKAAAAAGDETFNENRKFQCILWHSFAYTPWVMGQFGMTPEQMADNNVKETASSDEAYKNSFMTRVKESGGKHAYVEGSGSDAYVLDVLKGQGAEPLRLFPVQFGAHKPGDNDQTWALYLLDHRVNHDNASESEKWIKSRGQMAVYANQLGPTDYNADFKGASLFNQGFSVLLALAASIMIFIMMLVFAVSIMIMDLGLLFLVILSPLVAVAALFPGVGRQLAARWFTTIVQLALKRIALSAALGVAILLLQIAMTMGTEEGLAGWITAIVMVGSVAWMGIKVPGMISDTFANLKIGGATAFKNMPDGITATRTAYALGKTRVETGVKAATSAASGNYAGAVDAVASAGDTYKRTRASQNAKAHINGQLLSGEGGAGPKPDTENKPAPQTKSEAEAKPAGGNSESTTKPVEDVNGKLTDAKLAAAKFAQGTGGSTDSADSAGEESRGTEDEVAGSGPEPQFEMPAKDSEPIEVPEGAGPTPELPENEATENEEQAGSGAAPVLPVPAKGSEGTAPNADGSGAGESAAPVLTRKEERQERRATAAVQRKQQRAALGIVARSSAKAMAVGVLTGDAKAGVRAGSRSLAAQRQKIDARNREATKRARALEEERRKALEAQKKADKQTEAKGKSKGGGAPRCATCGKFVSSGHMCSKAGNSQAAPKTSTTKAPAQQSAPTPKADSQAAPQVKPQSAPKPTAAPKETSAPPVKPKPQAAPQPPRASRHSAPPLKPQPTKPAPSAQTPPRPSRPEA
ncbi:hypothetical protein ACWG8W_06405 [Citricoccus zhacaiensis]